MSRADAESFPPTAKQTKMDIRSFMKRNDANPSSAEDKNQSADGELAPASKRPKHDPVNSAVRVSTVKNWQTELKENGKYLEYETKETSEKDSKGEVITKIWCSVCRTFSKDKSAPFVIGTSNIKKETVKKHFKSVSHVDAMKVKSVKQHIDTNQATAIMKGLKNMEKNLEEKMIKLFRTAFHVAFYEKPFVDFPRLLELQECNGLEIGDSYKNDKQCKQFIDIIGSIYHDEMKQLLKDADFFSVLSDSSTDRTESEKEIIYVRVVRNGYPTCMYLKLIDLESGKADGIVQALDRAFGNFDFTPEEWRAKTVGFGCDGASVMTGKVNGVGAILKRDIPWLAQIHCLAHRLELAIKDCLKNTYMEDMIDVLVSVYYFYKGSPKRLRELKSVADIMEEQSMTPERANGTRWVEHKQKALAKLEKTWNLIVFHLESYASDNSNRAEDRAKARGIHNRLLQHKLVLYMHFLLDIFDQMAQLSLLFQRDDITVPSVVLKSEHVQLMLTSLLTENGAFLESFYQQLDGAVYKGQTLKNVIQPEVFERDRERIINSLLEVFDRRFSNILGAGDIYKACQIFDPRNWPEQPNELAVYGREDLLTLMRHFQQLLAHTNPPVNENDVNVQWSELKVLVNGNNNLKNLHPNSLWQRILQTDQDRNEYTSILKVIFLVEVFPLSTACCERGFSTMKRIKNDWRCNLATETLDTLMRVKIIGAQTFRDYDPRPAVNRWWLSAERARRPNIMPYGHHQ